MCILFELKFTFLHWVVSRDCKAYYFFSGWGTVKLTWLFQHEGGGHKKRTEMHLEWPETLKCQFPLNTDPPVKDQSYNILGVSASIKLTNQWYTLSAFWKEMNLDKRLLGTLIWNQFLSQVNKDPHGPYMQLSYFVYVRL